MAVELLQKLSGRFGAAIARTHSEHGDDTAIVDGARLTEVATFVRDELKMDMLVDVTCVDTLGLDARERGRFEMVYHFRNMETGKRLRIKALVDEGDGEPPAAPEIDSLVPLWRGANWFEREVYDMFGVRFRGHPDLRRILMYEEFVGHPLRKDYPKDKRQPLVRRDFS